MSPQRAYLTTHIEEQKGCRFVGDCFYIEA
jgi:hypothetical protein